MDENLVKLNMIQLRESVVVATLPAERQISSYPSFVVVADEIALDFDNWCRWVLDCSDVELSKEQRASLETLDRLFDQMSGEQNAHLWTDDALRTRPEWEEVRRKAQRICKLFGWAENEPQA